MTDIIAPPWKPVPLPLRQEGALPFRVGADGAIEIALVTSRETRRWIIPKGWSSAGESPADAALREAFEEAGLVGRMSDDPLGAYRYGKRRAGGRITECEVTIHLLAVEEELEDWPERRYRQRRWLPAEEVATSVEEEGLGELLTAIDFAAAIQAMLAG